METSQPLAPGERAPSVDALRGFAVFGIFLVNLNVMSAWVMISPERQAALPTFPADMTVIGLLMVFLFGKFYSLFSLLFGLGFAIYLSRGAEALPRFRRRLAVLLGIGLLHALLLWEGDILVLYALLGFVLIPFRHLPDRALLRWTVALILAPVVVDLVRVATGGAFQPEYPLHQLRLRLDVWAGADHGDVLTHMLSPSLVTQLKANVAGLAWRFEGLVEESRPFKVLGMFVLGLWVGRAGIAFRPEQHVPLLLRVRRIGFQIGLPMNVLLIVAFATGYAPPALPGTLAYALGVVPMALAIAAWFLLLWTRAERRPLLERLVPVGRMALTSYLTHSLVALLIFRGIGLGLAGRVGPAVYLPLGLGFVLLQVAVSRWWLARWRYGPVEWVWRMSTYGRRVGLRK